MANNFSFTGALGRDSELKALPSGDALLSFNVANNTGYGEKRQTLWVSCSIFGKRAESLYPYLKKGQSVFVSGELKTREYTGKDGASRTSLEMNPNVVDFVGGRPDQQQDKTDGGLPFNDDVPDF